MTKKKSFSSKGSGIGAGIGSGLGLGAGSEIAHQAVRSMWGGQSEADRGTSVEEKKRSQDISCESIAKKAMALCQNPEMKHQCSQIITTYRMLCLDEIEPVMNDISYNTVTMTDW